MAQKNNILNSNAQVGKLFARAYKYLAATKSIFDDIVQIYSEAVNPAGVSIEAQKVIDKEFGEIPIANNIGNVRKLFGSAITPDGLINHLESIINVNSNIYIVKGAPGTGTEKLLARIVETAVDRGLHIEVYYCPLEPENRIEHVVIPELSLAFTTSNKYHISTAKTNSIIDLNNYLNGKVLDQYTDVLNYNETIFDDLLNMSVQTIKKAKDMHDLMETYYIPNMNFDEVEKCLKNTLQRILRYAGE